MSGNVRSGSGALLAALLLSFTSFSDSASLFAQSRSEATSSSATQTSTSLEREFFAAIREGDAKKILSYIPPGGVNLGAQAQHTSRDEIEQQFQSHQGIYCKLFDSSCIDARVDLANSSRSCSYRELLTQSEKVNTAASEMTRGGVKQAILVARIKNDQCSNTKLIDFIFNLEADGWKLFSIP